MTPRLAYYGLIWSPPSFSHRPLPLPPPYASVCMQLLNPSQYDGAGQTRCYPTRLLCAQQRAFWQPIREALNEDDGMRIMFLLSLIVGNSTSYSYGDSQSRGPDRWHYFQGNIERLRWSGKRDQGILTELSSFTRLPDR